MAKAVKEVRPAGLRAWRERSGLSRSRLARRLAIELDPQTLYRLETFPNPNPTLATANALVDALSEALGEEITVYDLFPRASGR